MTPEQFDSVQAVFLTLRGLSTAVANDRLIALCGGDAVVESAVRSMLEHDSPDDQAHHETLPPLILGTNVNVESFLSAAEPGQRIGPYRIVRLIGRGGQAEVYEAEQTGPSRRVAIKIIKLGMDSRDVVARFEAERQALAIMDHPNIAKVFDSGVTPQGRPFFVMEYVPGVAITDHCDRHRLTILERLELFSLLCNAVSHAHTKGVIHRDLKPSNILVTIRDGNAAVPVIIDFGVAKATQMRLTEHTMFTEQGVMIGTPEYMSPEQADMTQQDIDTRSDVYSLGVVLYELLSGTVPFESKTLRERGLEEIRRIIREETPQRPSTKLMAEGKAGTEAAEARQTLPRELAQQLSHELEWIPLKAIRKNRDERYRSAQELGDDLRNYLDGRPLIAGPETAGYRVRKFVRRNRLEVGTVTVICAALATGLGVAVWQRNAATRARDNEKQQRVLAESTQEFWSKIIGQAANLYGQDRVTVRQAIDLAVRESIASSNDRPLAVASRNALLAEAFFNLSDYPQAQKYGEAAWEGFARELGMSSEPSLTARWNTGLSRWPQEQALVLDEMQASVEALLAASSSSDTKNWERMASLAALLALGGRREEAQQWLNRLEAARTSMGDPADSRYAAQVEMARAQLALDPAASVLHWQKAVNILETRLGPKHRETLEATTNLAMALSYSVQDNQAASEVFEDLMTRVRAVYAPPNLVIADTAKELAACLMVLDREALADQYAQEAIGMFEQLEAECHPHRTHDLLLGLEQMHRRLKHQDRANEVAEQRKQLVARCEAKKAGKP